MRLSPLFISLSLLFFTACNDKSLVTFYDKNIANEQIKCMKLVVFPPDKYLTKEINSLYHFSSQCDFTLNISQKNNIVCNSTHNLDKKVLKKFPTSYLNLTLKKDGQMLYSYYIDLEESVQKEDIKDGFERLKSDLNF